MQTKLLINGELVAGQGAAQTVVDPATGEAITAIPEASSCLLYTSPSPRDLSTSRMPSSA